MENRYYYDKAYGRFDINSEKLPKHQKLIMILLFILGGMFAATLIVAGIVVIIEDSLFGLLFILGGVVFGGVFVGLAFLSRMNYYKRRKKIIEKINSGEIESSKIMIKETFDSTNFYGIVVNTAEIGTNVLGWVRGINPTDSITPVSVRFSFTNKTGKPIKYATFSIRPYNAVGDAVSCTVTGVSLYCCKATGPFAPNNQYTQILSDAWYNNTIDHVEIEKVDIIYMDNTTETISDDRLKCIKDTTKISDNNSRVMKVSFGKILFAISLIVDIICIPCIFLINVPLFSVLLVISSITFILSLVLDR